MGLTVFRDGLQQDTKKLHVESLKEQEKIRKETGDLKTSLETKIAELISQVRRGRVERDGMQAWVTD